jgi:tryptophanase
MFGAYDENGNETASPLELVRLAFPRRVYTQSHFDYLIEVIREVWENRQEIPGYKITYQARFLRHFTCHFEKLARVA